MHVRIDHVPAARILTFGVAAMTLALVLAVAAVGAVAAVPFDQRHFIAAIHSAAVPDRADVDTQLFALSDANDRLIWRAGTNRTELAVAVVMTTETYRKYYAAGSGTTPSSTPVVWVTLAPQLRSWCRQFARRLAGTAVRHTAQRGIAERVRQRVVQRLGLSPRTAYSKVVEMWVNRADIFRPCPDPGVVDRRCQLEMQGSPQVKGVADYPAFFASLYVSSYSTSGAPWTRLGYTYDWGGPSRFGESEYMLTTSTAYEVRSAAGISDYCR